MSNTDALSPSSVPSEITPLRSFYTMAINLVGALTVAVFTPDARVVTFGLCVVIVALMVGLFHACDRHRRALQELADAQREGIALSDRLAATYKAEASRYRRAIAYAKRVGDGMDPREVGIAVHRKEADDA